MFVGGDAGSRLLVFGVLPRSTVEIEFDFVTESLDRELITSSRTEDVGVASKLIYLSWPP